MLSKCEPFWLPSSQIFLLTFPLYIPCFVDSRIFPGLTLPGIHLMPLYTLISFQVFKVKFKLSSLLPNSKMEVTSSLNSHGTSSLHLLWHIQYFLLRIMATCVHIWFPNQPINSLIEDYLSYSSFISHRTYDSAMNLLETQ